MIPWDSRYERAAESEANLETKQNFLHFEDAETGEVSPFGVIGSALYANIRAYLADRGVVEKPAPANAGHSVYVMEREEMQRLEATFNVSYGPSGPWKDDA